MLLRCHLLNGISNWGFLLKLTSIYIAKINTVESRLYTATEPVISHMRRIISSNLRFKSITFLAYDSLV